jgi:5-methylcytosine-specific restriction protein A
MAVLDLRRAIPPAKQADPVYQRPEHRAWRKLVIARAGGRCEWVERGRRCDKLEPEHVMYADHVCEVKDGGALLDLANGQCLCASHHKIKTDRARLKRWTR